VTDDKYGHVIREGPAIPENQWAQQACKRSVKTFVENVRGKRSVKMAVKNSREKWP
jgi:hypothetical protein